MDAQELQLWIATVSGLAGLGGTIWQALRYLRRPRLRVVRRGGRVYSWKLVRADRWTDYGIEVESTGSIRAVNARVLGEFDGHRFTGQFYSGSGSYAAEVAAPEKVRLFSIFGGGMTLETVGSDDVVAERVLMKISNLAGKRVMLWVRSDNVEGCALRIQLDPFVREADSYRQW